MAKTPDHYDVIVIGAGPAGTAAALRAAELGARVAVVEAVRTGGTCVNTGCVPTRVLAKTARLAREVRIAHQYGLAVSDPVVDWASTVARVRSTVDRVRDLKAEPERFEPAGIDLILEGRAHFADATTLELDSGRRLTGDSIIVARRRPLPPAAHPRRRTRDRPRARPRPPGAARAASRSSEPATPAPSS